MGVKLLENNMRDDTKYKPSGIVIFSLAKVEREDIRSEYSWGNKDALNVKKWKSNIITGYSSHFGSTGNYYSFGNRANYGLIGTSSLTQFTQKKFKCK